MNLSKPDAEASAQYYPIFFLLTFVSQSTYKLFKSPQYSEDISSTYIPFPVNTEKTRVDIGTLGIAGKLSFDFDNDDRTTYELEQVARIQFFTQNRVNGTWDKTYFDAVKCKELYEGRDEWAQLQEEFPLD